MGRKNYTAGRKHAEMLLNALLLFVEELAESTACADLEKMAKANWQADTELWVTQTTLKGLAELTDRYGNSLDTEQIRNAIACLEALKILEDKREQISRKTRTNSDVWRFALKLPSIDTEENLKWLFEPEGEWDKRRQAQKSKPGQVQKPTAPKSQGVEWSKICRTMLEKQKRLTTNELLSADEYMKFELKDIHVPLALVQRTKPDKRSGDVSPEQGSRLYEPTYEEKQRFKHEDFLAQVLQEGKGQSKGRRIALIGEPGAGKTTLLQAIAFWITDNNLGLPIWISLADLQGKTLEEYLLQRWLKNALEVVRVTSEQENALVELFKSNRVWLLLDGVDEIMAGSVGVGAQCLAPLQMIASQLEGWVAKARVVLSCRLNVWEANINALGDDFDTYRLLDFDYPLQVKEFICRWFRKTDAGKGQQLWTELDKSERQRIQDLVKNPLRLALLCSTWQSSDKGLPSTKADLYQRFVEVFYTWKKNRFPTTFEQRQELNAALGRLALRAIDSEESRFRLRHKVVYEVLGDPEQEDSLFGLALQLGWLNKVGLAAESETQEKVYAFFHPTFQEYFAALAIDDWDFFLNHVPHNPAQGTYRIFEPHWKEVILLWLGREDVAKEQKERFIKALVTFEDGWEDFYHYRAYFLAGAGIAEFRDNSSIEGVKEAFLNRENAFFKDYVMSVEELSQYRNLFQEMPGTADLQNSSNANDIVANLAILGFGYYWPYRNGWRGFLMPHGTEEARVALQETDRDRAIALLAWLIPTKQPQVPPNGTYGPNEGTQMNAAWILGKIGTGNKTAIKALEWLVQNAQDEHIRRIAVENLRKIDSNNAIARQTLINSISITQYKEDSIRVAESAKFALHTLFSKIQNFPEEGIGVQAVEKLKEIKLSNKEAAIKALEWLIDNIENEEIIYHSAVSLGRVDPGNETASRVLLKLLQTHSYDPIVLPFSDNLKQNLRGRQYSEAVTQLKDYFFKPILPGGGFRKFLDCYQVIWHCVQNMTYPAFYQAWHPQEEVEQTTTPGSQPLNQANLPQSLQSAIANDPQLSQTIHLICIDRSQIIDPDRPAAEIYDQMLDQNCPECDSVPETMPALKLYWNSLKRNSDKRLVLVFYASSTDTTSAKDTACPCPYSETFLSDLSKFGDRICVVTNQPLDHISLKFFTPSHAIAHLLDWIRTIC